LFPSLKLAFVYHPTYLIYKEVIGFEEENPVEVIE